MKTSQKNIVAVTQRKNNAYRNEEDLLRPSRLNRGLEGHDKDGVVQSIYLARG